MTTVERCLCACICRNAAIRNAVPQLCDRCYPEWIEFRFERHRPVTGWPPQKRGR